MLVQRVSRVAAAASALLLVLLQDPVRAELSGKSVCTFETGKLYVRDATQTAFPPGFLSCVGADGKAIARCAECKCRDKQSGTTSGLQVEWGLCVEGTEGCVTAQTPDREYCGNATESGAAFVPGKVIGADTDATSSSSPKADETGGVQELASNTQISNGANKSSSNAFIVGGCAVAGVAAVAMFAVARKRQNEDRELGTPVQDLGPAYDHNNTAKAKDLSASTISYKNRLSERMTGDSILDDDSYRHQQALPAPVPTSARGYSQQHQAQHHQQQLPSFAPSAHRAPPSPERESSFIGSVADDRFTIDDTFGRSGVDSFAYSTASEHKDFGASYLSVDESARTMDFDDSKRSNGWDASGRTLEYDSQRSQDWDDSQRSNGWDESARTMDYDDSQRSKGWEDSARTMDFDDSKRSKGWEDSARSQDWEDSQRSQDWDDSVRTMDYDDSARSVDFGASGMSNFSVDLGASSASVDFGASSASVDFSATARSDTSAYGSRVTSLSMESNGLSMVQRDTAASEFMRESEDSVVFSGRSTNLSFYEEEARSPRKSIEF